MATDLFLKVGNDIGNSEHDIVINGDIIQQPNVFARIRNFPDAFLEMDFNPILNDIHNNLAVSISSHSVETGNYYIGEYACNSGQRLHNIEVGADNSKVESDVIVICTLSQIAAFSAKKAYQENKKESQINTFVDMTTSLPVTQYNKKNVASLTDKFMGGTHIVKVFCGNKSFDVTIKFEFVRVLPESVPIVFYLQNLTNAAIENTNEPGLKAMLEKDVVDIFKEFNDLYKDKLPSPIDGSFFIDKKIQHGSIGEGTTEYPQTKGIVFDPNFIHGTNNGVGHATKDILDIFMKSKSLIKFSRQDFSKVIKDTTHKYHEDAIDLMEIPLENQAAEIFENLKDEVRKSNNDVDIISIHGGGSILMRDYLFEKLLEFSKKVGAYLFFVPQKYAVTLECKGMYAFVNSPIFQHLKKKHK